MFGRWIGRFRTWYPAETFLDPDALPRVLHHEDVKQEVEVRPQFVRVGDGDLPQELVQHGVGEGGILPRAELKQLLRVLLRVRLLYQLLEITVRQTVMDIKSTKLLEIKL